MGKSIPVLSNTGIVIANQDPGKGVANYSSFTLCMMWKYDWRNQVLLCKIKNIDPIDERDKSLTTLQVSFKYLISIIVCAIRINDMMMISMEC